MFTAPNGSFFPVFWLHAAEMDLIVNKSAVLGADKARDLGNVISHAQKQDRNRIEMLLLWTKYLYPFARESENSPR